MCCSPSLAGWFLGADPQESDEALVAIGQWFDLWWPISLNTVLRMGFLVIDLSFLGHLGTKELAGAAVGNSFIFLTAASLWRSAGGATGVLASQSVGAGNKRLSAIWLQTGIYVGFLLCIPVALLWIFSEPVLVGLGYKESEAVLAARFCRLFAIGLPPTVVFYAVTAWLQSLSIVRLSLIVSAVMVGLNVALNIVLIHGFRFFDPSNESLWPGLGFDGSPIATALGRWLSLGVMFALMALWDGDHHKAWKESGIQIKEALDPSKLWEWGAKQFLPMVGAGLVYEVQVQLLAYLAARLAPSALSAHTSFQDLFYLLTSAVYAGSSATSTKTGHYLGAGQPEWAKRVAYFSIKFAAAAALPVSAVLLGLRWRVGYLFSTDGDVLPWFGQIALIVGCGWPIVSANYTLMGIIGGQGRATIRSYVGLAAGWGVVVPCALVAELVLHWEVYGLWGSTAAGWLVSALLLTVAFLWSDWEDLAR